MLYSCIRQLLFSLQPELSHDFSLKALHSIPGFMFPKPKANPINCMGLTFPHQIGLAAGLDKNGDHLDALAKLGFAFIELGTVTPRPQLGNPKPRLFRLPKAHALINRMGFNNRGVDFLVSNLSKSLYQGIVGVNIGKNKDTPLNQAVDDYSYCLRRVYKYASYVTINISSPNTKDLRQLQQEAYFSDLMRVLRQEQLDLERQHKRYVPLLVKLSPDESDEVLKTMAEVILTYKIDGIIATNTTCKREGVSNFAHGDELGGLSGRPLFESSTHSLKVIKQVVGDEVTLVGVGGIDSKDKALAKLKAGASLLQVYTGLIYHGPGLVNVLK